MNAAQSGDAQTVRVLLDGGAEVNAATECGWTPLLFAAASGDEQRVWLLLEAGADSSCRTQVGTTPAEVAALNRHEGIVKMLALYSR
jgi:ankyrin repeat protein